VHPLKSTVSRARTGGIPDCTSNPEENAAYRRGLGKEGVHRLDPHGGGEAVGISRKVDANGSRPLRSPNCVHYVSEPVGEHLKYLVWAQGRPVACLAWSSAPRHLASRDSFIGWNGEARRRNIRHLAYNTRFLILPWIAVPHLASHILGRMARQISQDWERIYGHPIYYLETFIDPERFRGTCYRAANWMVLGRTTGRGKDDQTHRANRSIKEVLGLPITRGFRELLRQE
jgi:Domain of unknown function (DUF4338)